MGSSKSTGRFSDAHPKHPQIGPARVQNLSAGDLYDLRCHLAAIIYYAVSLSPDRLDSYLPDASLERRRLVHAQDAKGAPGVKNRLVAVRSATASGADAGTGGFDNNSGPRSDHQISLPPTHALINAGD